MHFDWCTYISSDVNKCSRLKDKEKDVKSSPRESLRTGTRTRTCSPLYSSLQAYIKFTTLYRGIIVNYCGQNDVTVTLCINLHIILISQQ